MKSKWKLGLVAVMAGAIALVLMLGVGVASAEDCYCAQPVLNLQKDSVYWASEADYNNGILSVDYSIHNGSTNMENAHNVSIVYLDNTNGVTGLDSGRTINMVSQGECENLTVQYLIPNGVAGFNTTVYATADDQCGTTYDYPGPAPL